MRRIAEHSNAAGGPALELDQLKRIVAAVLAEPRDQASEMGKRARPFRLVDRNAFRGLIAVEHRERDVNFGFTARREQDSSRTGPVFDGHAGRRERWFARVLLDQQAGGSVW